MKKYFIAPLLVSMTTTPAISTSAENIEPALTAVEMELASWAESQEEEMLELLEQITNINSGTLNKKGVDEIAQIFNNELLTLGFSTSRLPGDVIEMPSCPGSDYDIDVTDHLLASKKGPGAKLLLMGHIDTVFPITSPFKIFKQEGDTMFGPGVSDMHGGLVIMLYALKALEANNELSAKSITILLNSDEEIGSLSSRKYIEQQARLHDWGLVYESSGTDKFVRARKGLGQARIVVNGRASHAGGAHAQGRSAIKELAYKIIEIENMTNYETGVTVNVGIIGGGEARNTIAPCAEALVDLRYPEPRQGADAREQLEQIANQVYSYPIDTNDIQTERWINLHRPPKNPTPESDYLLEKAIAIGRLLQQELGVTDSGGGTDGSLSQAVGLPTLDSLGVAGTGAHSNREEARVSSLIERVQLSAILIHRLTSK